MSVRIATHSVRDLRDALDAAEHDLANGVPGARFAVNYNRRELESMAYNLASDLLDARAALATERERCARLCDAAAARWALIAPGDSVMTDDRRARHNEAAALAAEIRGGDLAGCP